MKYKLQASGIDLTPFLAEGGLTLYPIRRIQREVVTRDGTSHRAYREKQGIKAVLHQISDTDLAQLIRLLPDLTPVRYTDKTGVDREGIFWVAFDGFPSPFTQRGVTYFDGVTITMEEK